MWQIYCIEQQQNKKMYSKNTKMFLSFYTQYLINLACQNGQINLTMKTPYQNLTVYHLKKQQLETYEHGDKPNRRSQSRVTGIRTP